MIWRNEQAQVAWSRQDRISANMNEEFGRPNLTINLSSGDVRQPETVLTSFNFPEVIRRNRKESPRLNTEQLN